MKRPKIAVIGAGWAGLSAALALSEHEVDVSIFEAGRVAGGRARSLVETENVPFSGMQDGLTHLDNGQHILSGAYTQTLALLKKMGVSEQEVLLRLPFYWYLHDGLQFETPAISAPWHILLGVLSAKNFSFTEKIKFLVHAAKLQNFSIADVSIESWLSELKVSRKEVINFWQPLVLAAMNTPLNVASTQTLSKVLNDGVLKDRAASDLLLPKQSLNQLFVKPVCHYLRERNVSIHYKNRVQSVKNDDLGNVWVDSQRFNVVILATAPYHAVKVLPNQFHGSLINQLQYASISTLYLRYTEEVFFPYPMVGFGEGSAQWLFARGMLSGSRNEIAAVISCADQLQNNDCLREEIHQDILKICPDLSQPIASRLITEKRATFMSQVNRVKFNDIEQNLPGVYLAGDYMHPYYPGTLEGAVISGQIAAEKCLLICG